jgi:hypothetical protein
MEWKLKVENCKTYDNPAGWVKVYIGRGSVLGNRFRIGKDGTRDEVVKMYEDEFESRLTEPAFRNELVQIYKLLKSGKKVALMCYCKPARCHGDIVKKFLENNLKGE